ncbi:hypothetical protein [Spirosoma flavum]|uniref:Helix-turn-helix domain-containing protein n=1 Tax=Spirosoma flavum TaxID=2048557 RepID=A0ABW6ALT7_9BACT
MDHLFLLRTQAHELKMRQMVEEINLGRLTIPQAMAKFNVLTRHTVRKWLDRVRHENFQRADAMKQASQQPPPALVEQMALKADELAGQVIQLKKELEQAELQVIYYTTIIRVAEQELGIAIEKKSVTKQSNSFE